MSFYRSDVIVISVVFTAKRNHAIKQDRIETAAVVTRVSEDATDAWVSLHQKQSDGSWHMIMTSPGFIGKNGLGKTKEGDAKTPTRSL